MGKSMHISLFHFSFFNISEFYQPHIRSGKVLHNIGSLTCDSHHKFASIQGIGCEINCLNFCTLWEGVCTDIFSISDYVCRSDFDSRKKHSDNAPTSSVDEIQGVSPLLSCMVYTLAHDHGIHWFLHQVFHQEAVHSAHSSEYKHILKTCYFKFCALSFLEEVYSPCGFSHFLTFMDMINC